MTIDELERTQWAKRLKRQCPEIYTNALAIASDPTLEVYVVHTSDAGDWLWSIVAVIKGKSTGFWLDSFETEEEAKKLCEDMNWKIK